MLSFDFGKKFAAISAGLFGVIELLYIVNSFVPYYSSIFSVVSFVIRWLPILDFVLIAVAILILFIADRDFGDLAMCGAAALCAISRIVPMMFPMMIGEMYTYVTIDVVLSLYVLIRNRNNDNNILSLLSLAAFAFFMLRSSGLLSMISRFVPYEIYMVIINVISAGCFMICAVGCLSFEEKEYE